MKSARIHPVAKPMADACRQLYASGLTPGFSGQASVRDDDFLWITPVGMSFRDIEPEHLIAVCPDGRILGEDSEPLRTRLSWHRALYQTAPHIQSILVAKPPKLAGIAQYQYQADPKAGALSLPPWSQSVGVIVPQSDASRAEAIKTAFTSFQCLYEIGLGAILATDTLTAALNLLEELEASLQASPN